MTITCESKFPKGTSVRRVVDYATKEFFTKGVKSVTMDDIAHGLQMSKRTLYQLFTDKERLIIACIELISEEERKMAAQLFAEDHNVLEIILRIIEYRIKLLEQVSSRYIIDITRYDAVKDYITTSSQEAIIRASDFLRLGTAQGYFRPDVNYNLFIQCVFARINSSSSLSLFQTYDIHECFINMGIFHLRGCCTNKGIEIIDRFIERYREEHQ